jgi:hypothetical protein
MIIEYKIQIVRWFIFERFRFGRINSTLQNPMIIV